MGADRYIWSKSYFSGATGACAPVAIVNATGHEPERVRIALQKHNDRVVGTRRSRRSSVIHGTYVAAWTQYAKELGFVSRTTAMTGVVCNGTAPADAYINRTVRAFAKDHPRGVFLIGTRGHVLCVIDGRYMDRMDSGARRVRVVLEAPAHLAAGARAALFQDYPELSCPEYTSDAKLTARHWVVARRAAGDSYAFIAKQLNAHGIRTARGAVWHDSSVYGVVKAMSDNRETANVRVLIATDATRWV